jgi:hypothetical protein
MIKQLARITGRSKTFALSGALPLAGTGSTQQPGRLGGLLLYTGFQVVVAGQEGAVGVQGVVGVFLGRTVWLRQPVVLQGDASHVED